MNESEAIVTRVEGDHVWLDINGRLSCASCEQAAGCGLGDGKGKPPQRFRNTVGASVGDTVNISVPEGAVIKAAFYSYLIPLALALGGAATGMFLGGDASAVLGAVFGLITGWLVLRYANGRFAPGREPLLTMRIKGVVVHHLHRNRTP
jgi:sigma-E factor negative regulatory protein RseC